MPKAELEPGDSVQVGLQNHRSDTWIWLYDQPNSAGTKFWTTRSARSMDAHDMGLVIAVVSNEDMNWCLVSCKEMLGWTLEAFLDKVPRG